MGVKIGFPTRRPQVELSVKRASTVVITTTTIRIRMIMIMTMTMTMTMMVN